LFQGVAAQHEGSSEKMYPSKAVDVVGKRLNKALDYRPILSSLLADLPSARDYEVDEESRRPRSDAKEQV
jgi:hypothetical protein